MATYLDHTVLPAFAVENKFVLIQYPGRKEVARTIRDSETDSDQRPANHWMVQHRHSGR